MRHILFIILLFSLPVYSFAQKNKKPAPVEVRMFKMPRFPNADLPKKSIPIAGIKIVQVLRDSIIMGYGMEGMNDHVVVLVPEKPPTIFLQEAVNKMYRHDFKEDGAWLLWVIKNLRLGEKVNNRYSYLRMEADAYISKDGLAYKPVCNLDSVFVSEGIADVTAWHGEDIENAFRVLLKNSLVEGKEVLEKNTQEASLEKIKERSIANIDAQILYDEVYNEGAYASFEEFLQNKPSVINYRVFSIGKEKLIKVVKIKENNQADTINIWGLCKAGEIYKFDQGLFVSIERQRNGFIISNYVELANRRNNGIFLSGFLGALGGGLIVGIVAGAVSAEGADMPLLVRTIPYIKKTKKMPDATCIDMKTGELSF